MAKKVQAFRGDRKDPKQNKSLAIRMILKAKPKSKASEVAAEVEKQFGHVVSVNQIYMIKTKKNMKVKAKAKAKAKESSSSASNHGAAPASPEQWVDAIKLATQLLNAAGSVANATALLKAIGS